MTLLTIFLIVVAVGLAVWLLSKPKGSRRQIQEFKEPLPSVRPEPPSPPPAPQAPPPPPPPIEPLPPEPPQNNNFRI